MSGKAPKQERKKKSNKGRKPKKPLSSEEIAAKKNQKNMRETCRRVEINLHYELLYHSLGLNLVYNRAERVQLLRKAIIKMAELTGHVKELQEQLQVAGIPPRERPNYQLNDSQKLFMLVQRWSRNDSGKKCSRAKLKPVGIEIVDDGTHEVPITVPVDGRTIRSLPSGVDSEHIPFWAGWETDSYVIVDQEAFEKACGQAMIAGWDGKLGTKGSYYQRGLPDSCGLTVSTSTQSPKRVRMSRKRRIDRNTNSMNPNIITNTNNINSNNMNPNMNSTMVSDDDSLCNISNNMNNMQNMRCHSNTPSNSMSFPSRIDFPGLSTSTGNGIVEPPNKRRKLNHLNHCAQVGQGNLQDQLMNLHNYQNGGEVNGLPLSVPMPSVRSSYNLGNNIHHPMSAMPSPFRNQMNRVGLESRDKSPIKSELVNRDKLKSPHQKQVQMQQLQLPPLPNSIPPQQQMSQNQMNQNQMNQQPVSRVQLPYFLASFPPQQVQQFGNQLGTQMGTQIGNQVGNQIENQIGNQMENQLQSLPNNVQSVQNFGPLNGMDNLNVNDMHNLLDNINQMTQIHQQEQLLQQQQNVQQVQNVQNVQQLQNNLSSPLVKNTVNGIQLPPVIGGEQLGQAQQLRDLNETPSHGMESMKHVQDGRNSISPRNLGFNNLNGLNDLNQAIPTTPPRENAMNISSGSRTTDETRNSVMNTHDISMDTISLDDGENLEKEGLQLPDELLLNNNLNNVNNLNTVNGVSGRKVRNEVGNNNMSAIEQYVTELAYAQEAGAQNNNGLVLRDEFNLVADPSFERYDGTNHIELINEIPVNGYQAGNAAAMNQEDGNGLKGSAFYG